MNLTQLFRRFHLETIRLNAALVRADITFVDEDRDAAWELYIEMLTRIVTQPLPSEVGDEATAARQRVLPVRHHPRDSPQARTANSAVQQGSYSRP